MGRGCRHSNDVCRAVDFLDDIEPSGNAGSSRQGNRDVSASSIAKDGAINDGCRVVAGLCYQGFCQAIGSGIGQGDVAKGCSRPAQGYGRIANRRAGVRQIAVGKRASNRRNSHILYCQISDSRGSSTQGKRGIAKGDGIAGQAESDVARESAATGQAGSGNDVDRIGYCSYVCRGEDYRPGLTVDRRNGIRIVNLLPRRAIEYGPILMA